MPDVAIEELSDDTARQPLITTAEMVILAITLIICVLIMYPWQTSDNYFSGYITADNAPTDCQYYFNNDASNFSRHTAFINKNLGCVRAINLSISPPTLNPKIIRACMSLTDEKQAGKRLSVGLLPTG